MRNNRPIIAVLLIIALASAGISPACAFISGKTSFIEICAADGTLKTVEVPADQSPFEEKQDDQEHHAAKNDCAFCFSHAHQKTGFATAQDYPCPSPQSFLRTGSGLYTPKSGQHTRFQPRAPPAFILS
ncbi:MAG: hypothetical protein R3E13_00485 [Alphaproteobacteria bacterium]